MIPLPSSLLSQLTHSQSKYYMLLEYLSRFYRTLVSTPPWFRYLSNAQNSGAVFAVIITAAYLMIKGGVIFSRLRELFRAFVNFLQDPVSGSLEVNAFSLLNKPTLSLPMLLLMKMEQWGGNESIVT